MNNKVRIADLKPGDKFIKMGNVYKVTEISKGRLYYKNVESGTYDSVGARSKEIVLKVIPKK